MTGCVLGVEGSPLGEVGRTGYHECEWIKIQCICELGYLLLAECCSLVSWGWCLLIWFGLYSVILVEDVPTLLTAP